MSFSFLLEPIANSRQRTAFYGVIALVIVAVGLYLRVEAIHSIPAYYDAAYYLNIGRNFLDRGELTPYMWRLGPTNIIAGSGTGYGILVLMGWYMLAGLSFIQARLFNMLIGIVSAGVLGTTAGVWFGRQTGIVTGLLLLVMSSPFYTFHVRMDALGTFSYSVLLLLYIVAVRRGTWWLHGLTGVVAVLTAEFHILGIIYLTALALVYAGDYVRTSIAQRQWIHRSPALWYYLGALIAGTIYILHHIMPNPEAYFIIPQSCGNCTPRSISKEIERWFGFYFQRRPVETLFLGFAVIAALLRFERNDQRWLALLLSAVVMIGIISPPSQLDYTIHLYPIIGLGIGAFIARGFKAGQSLNGWRALLGIVMGVMFLTVHQARIQVERNFPFLYSPETPEITYLHDQNLPTDVTLVAPVSTYLYFLDYPNFMSYHDGTWYGIQLRDETYLDLLERWQPQVILADIREDDDYLAYVEANNWISISTELWVSPAMCEIIDCNPAMSFD